VQRLKVLAIFKRTKKPKPSIEGGSGGLRFQKSLEFWQVWKEHRRNEINK
jgi:hypothetical protein